MNKQLDETLSLELARKIKSKSTKPFENAYKAALVTEGAKYVQGFLVMPGKLYQPYEHAWIEISDTSDNEPIIRILDPSLPHLKKSPSELWYFAAHTLTVKKLKAIIEESEEDYPEDDPLPIYGDAPYEYYGDVMLGGKNYLEAHQAAAAKCQELNQQNLENN
ncbi:hypothetical protein [Calothrix sp. 336/3]|uniref:hypothetical protein n=1 Tax=Calothrix sp. 336/3 TaxID=1337936 RepID=UPI0004E2ACE7|nr:hypothetical protein [Calothrix sp. 336/3]AKG24333.1 hypothetical protein IJ00_26135 [Calothrix sp. 336/3]